MRTIFNSVCSELEINTVDVYSIMNLIYKVLLFFLVFFLLFSWAEKLCLTYLSCLFFNFKWSHICLFPSVSPYVLWFCKTKVAVPEKSVWGQVNLQASWLPHINLSSNGGKEHKETKLKITSKENTNIALRHSVADKGRAGGNLLIQLLPKYMFSRLQNGKCQRSNLEAHDLFQIWKVCVNFLG